MEGHGFKSSNPSEGIRVLERSYCLKIVHLTRERRIIVFDVFMAEVSQIQIKALKNYLSGGVA